MTSHVSAVRFDRDLTNDNLKNINGNVLATVGPLNPLYLVFEVTLTNGETFSVATSRWAAGHTESFTARAVTDAGRIALPVSLPADEDVDRLRLKNYYHDAWFAQYPVLLAAAVNVDLANADELYAEVTRAVIDAERNLLHGSTSSEV